MEFQEKSSGLWCKVRGEARLFGKEKIYYCAHPSDVEPYFEQISESILKLNPNVAIFRCKEESEAQISPERQQIFSEMQLFVMPVTANLLQTPNMAFSREFPLAQKMDIPVLPLMEEPNLEELFNLKCRGIQFLDPHSKDQTAIPYQEKLQMFLQRVLLGDKLADEVKNAFFARLFLSYRKKNREYVNHLMHSIHQDPELMDLAIWYDEYLHLGKEFETQLKERMVGCDAVLLMVTEEILEPGNYVLDTEYPDAIGLKKPVIPAVVQEMSDERIREIRENYPGAGELLFLCGDPQGEEKLHSQLRVTLSARMKQRNPERWNNPRYLYLMGVAYLRGIEVEKDSKRAEKLLVTAAEMELPEACMELYSMYQFGIGVQRNYETARRWLNRVAVLREKRWKEHPGDGNAEEYAQVLYELALRLTQADRLDPAKAAYGKLRQLSEGHLREAPDDPDWGRYFLRSCMGQAETEQTQMHYQNAEAYLQDFLQAVSRQIFRNGQEAFFRQLSLGYSTMAEIQRQKPDLEKAQEYADINVELLKQMQSQFGSQEWAVELLPAYLLCGSLAMQKGDMEKAESYFRQMLRISKIQSDDLRTDRSYHYYALACEQIADTHLKWGDEKRAGAYLTEALQIYQKQAQRRPLPTTLRACMRIYRKEGKIEMDIGNYSAADTMFGKCLFVWNEATAENITSEDLTALAEVYRLRLELAERTGKRRDVRQYLKEFHRTLRRYPSDTGGAELSYMYAWGFWRLSMMHDAKNHETRTEWYLCRAILKCWNLVRKAPTPENQALMKKIDECMSHTNAPMAFILMLTLELIDEIRSRCWEHLFDYKNPLEEISQTPDVLVARGDEQYNIAKHYNLYLSVENRLIHVEQAKQFYEQAIRLAPNILEYQQKMQEAQRMEQRAEKMKKILTRLGL